MIPWPHPPHPTPSPLARGEGRQPKGAAETLDAEAGAAATGEDQHQQWRGGGGVGGPHLAVMRPMMAQWDYAITGAHSAMPAPPCPSPCPFRTPCPSLLRRRPPQRRHLGRGRRSRADGGGPGARGGRQCHPAGRKGDGPLGTPQITSSSTISSPRLCMISIGSGKAACEKRPSGPAAQRPKWRAPEHVKRRRAEGGYHA